MCQRASSLQPNYLHTSVGMYSSGICLLSLRFRNFTEETQTCCWRSPRLEMAESGGIAAAKVGDANKTASHVEKETNITQSKDSSSRK